jgi:hypothetical protein
MGNGIVAPVFAQSQLGQRLRNGSRVIAERGVVPTNQWRYEKSMNR